MVPKPATCNANMANSLIVSVTTIAESTMDFINFTLLALKLDTTICSVRDLCVVKCVSLFDLLLNESKCVHLFVPEILG